MPGTVAETYLRSRGITLDLEPIVTLRFHPALVHGPTELKFPAMLAAIQNADRRIAGVHRTYLHTLRKSRWI